MQIYKVGTQRGKERDRKEGRRGTMPSENSVLKRSAANKFMPDYKQKMVSDETRQHEQTLKAQRHPFWRNRQILIPHSWSLHHCVGSHFPLSCLQQQEGKAQSDCFWSCTKVLKWIHNSLHGPLHSRCHWPHPERALGSSCGRKLSLSWCLSCLAPCPAQQELRGFTELLGQLMDCEN